MSPLLRHVISRPDDNLPVVPVARLTVRIPILHREGVTPRGQACRQPDKRPTQSVYRWWDVSDSASPLICCRSSRCTGYGKRDPYVGRASTAVEHVGRSCNHCGCPSRDGNETNRCQIHIRT